MVDVAAREQNWIDCYAKPHFHDDFLLSKESRMTISKFWSIIDTFSLTSFPKTIDTIMVIYGTWICMLGICWSFHHQPA